jgi:hypothetical protein
MRHDAAELLAIKHGEWRLERIKGEAEHLFRRAEDVYERSALPVRRDLVRVNVVCPTMVEIALSERPALSRRARPA